MSRAVALTSLMLLVAASATWAGAVALGRHTPIVQNFIASELDEQRRTNGALQYHGGYVDDGDFLLMGEVAHADYSRGGVYFFGSSETRTTIKPWELPPGERAELAMALWESLSNAEREAELALTAGDLAELDRRWTDHVQRPESAIPWDEVRRKLLDRE